MVLATLLATALGTALRLLVATYGLPHLPASVVSSIAAPCVPRAGPSDRLAECVYLYSQGVTPYATNACRVPPLGIALAQRLGLPSGGRDLWAAVALDAALALLLAWVVALGNGVRDRHAPEAAAERLEARMEDGGNKVRPRAGFLTASWLVDARGRTRPAAVAAVWLCNPASVACACAGRSLAAPVAHCLVALALGAACSARPGLAGAAVACAAYAGAPRALTLLPAAAAVASAARGAPCSPWGAPLAAAAGGAAGTLAALVAASRLVSGSYDFLWAVYGAEATAASSGFNLGLWWYVEKALLLLLLLLGVLRPPRPATTIPLPLPTANSRTPPLSGIRSSSCTRDTASTSSCSRPGCRSSSRPRWPCGSPRTRRLSSSRPRGAWPCCWRPPRRWPTARPSLRCASGRPGSWRA